MNIINCSKCGSNIKIDRTLESKIESRILTKIQDFQQKQEFLIERLSYEVAELQKTNEELRAKLKKLPADDDVERLEKNNNFTLLITNLHDNDRAARRLARRSEAVFFSLSYVPPYENFNELKRLQLRANDADLFGSGSACIIMNISEWLGHENEEYFNVTMKFLRDQTWKWRYIFTVGNYSLNQVNPLLGVIKCYLQGSVRELDAFCSEPQISRYLHKEHRLNENSAKLLAALLSEKPYEARKSITFIESVVRDLKYFAGKRELSENIVAEYMRNDNSVVNIIGGAKLIEKYVNYATKGESADEKRI